MPESPMDTEMPAQPPDSGIRGRISSPTTPPYPADAGAESNVVSGPSRTHSTVGHEDHEAADAPDESDPKGAARRIGESAVTAGGEVAQTVKQQAGEVASEARQQAASLFTTIRTEVGEQSSTQQQRVAGALHEASAELGSMAAGSSKPDWMTDLMHEAARRGEEISHWLQDREPAEVVDAVCAYARRRPLTFLALCCLVGVAAGRITRSAVATHTRLDSPAVPSSHDRPLPELDTESTRPRRAPDAVVRGGDPVR